MDRCQKCKQIDYYWNAIGGTSVENHEPGYFKRKAILYSLFFGAIPIVGQVILAWALVYSYFQARRTDKPISKQFDEDYILKLVEKDKNKKKNRRNKK